MNKTKAGITVSLMSAAIYLCHFAGTIPMFLLCLYILIKEDDSWLRKNAVKAIVIELGFLFVYAIIGFFTSGGSIIDLLHAMTAETTSDSYAAGYREYSNIISLVQQILSLIENVIFIMMAIAAFHGQNRSVSFADNILSQHLENTAQTVSPMQQNVSQLRCPKCGAPVSPDDKFCQICGTPLNKQ